jgi:fluoride exporter
METAWKIFSVAIGGALGALARYAVSLLFAGKLAPFPLATFFINVTGSFFIGFLLYLFTNKFAVGENFRLAILVGFLGAYTTFSTFEMELFSLARERQFVTASLYVLLSVMLGFVAVLVGFWLAKKF